MNPDPTTLLGPEDLQRINLLLEELVAEAGARCSVLLDRNGHALTARGDIEGFDETSFASLAAADFAASDQLAELLGENEFRALYHQGTDGSMYLCEIAGAAILAAVFDRRTTLGMVRLKTRVVLPQLAALLQEMEGRPREPLALDADWSEDAANHIDRLFTG